MHVKGCVNLITFTPETMPMYSNQIFLWAGPQQIILIIVVILLLFGGRKIPELMRGLGSGIKEFKNASKEDDDTPSKEKDA